MSPDGAKPLHEMEIRDLAPLLEQRQVSPVEITDLLLRRIDVLDRRLNSFITVLADGAMAAARKAESEILAGDYKGPLHGVPVAIKDLFDVEGVPTTCGSRILAQSRAKANAVAVQQLLDAGVVILGKTNMHEFAYGVTSENPHYGDVRNPWEENHVAGGSSGGTAAALAASLSYGGLGSDTGGSIRIPASFCGVSGFKPTYGLVSREGVQPLAWSLDHAGPLARSIADCRLLFEATVTGRHINANSQPGIDISRLTLGVPGNYYFENIDPAVSEVVREAIQHLASLGAKTIQLDLPHVRYAQTTGAAIMGSEGASWHADWLATRWGEYGSDVLLRLRVGAQTLATEYLAAQKMRVLLQQDFAAAFRQVDVILAPSVGIVAPRIGHTSDPLPNSGLVPRAVINRLTVPANLTGMPAASVPCGYVGKLPVGLQILGPAYADDMVLNVGHAYQQTTTWHNRRPGL